MKLSDNSERVSDTLTKGLVREAVRVSKSKSIYLSSEGRSFLELHTIASELNLSSYARKRDLIFKVGESE